MIKKLAVAFLMVFFTFSFAVEGMIIKTTDASYRDRWEKTLGKTAPRISGVSTLFKGQQVFLGVAVTNFETDKNNKAHLSYSIKITNPRGKIYTQKENLKVLEREIQYKNYVQLSDFFLNLSFGFDDAFGKYEIETTISDHISGEKKLLTSEIQLVQLPDYESVKISGHETFTEWMSNYYKKQEPEKVLPYFVFFTQSELVNHEDSMLLVMNFFREIFRSNSFLFTQFSDAYNSGDEKTKMLLSALMYNSVDRESFNKFFPEQKMQELMKDTKLPDIYGEISSPIYLDMLWSEFYAGGKQKPILKLVKTLELSKFSGSIEAFKTSKKTQTDKNKAMQEAIYKAVVWSLENHFRSDELVLNYANWLMNSDEIDDSLKRQLGAILIKFN